MARTESVVDINPGRPCPVCGALALGHLMTTGDGRRYARCRICQATSLDPGQWPDAQSERAHYDLHENDPDDAGYRRFLARLAEPLLLRLPPASQGLDHGCGPGPALAAMLREASHAVALYDPFYAPDTRVLDRTYDFVTCTETAEHFHDPAGEFARLRRCVRPGGILAVMTCFQTDDARFERWHYRLDPTHVVFYREATFRHLARTWGWAIDVPCKDVVILTRPTARGGDHIDLT